MGFRPIDPGLRVMVNPSHDVAKVSLVVPAGDEVTVSDEVAGQLERQGFKPATPLAEKLDVMVAALENPTPELVAEIGETVKAAKGKKA